MVEVRDAVLLRRPTGGAGTVGPADRDDEVPTGGQFLEMMPRHVGVEVELLGDLTGGDPAGRLADREVDLAAGRVPPPAGGRGDGRAEIIGGGGGGGGHSPGFNYLPKGKAPPRGFQRFFLLLG